MKKPRFIIVALLSCLGMRAQTQTTSQTQAVTPSSQEDPLNGPLDLDSDPVFKTLTPAEQDSIRKLPTPLNQRMRLFFIQQNQERAAEEKAQQAPPPLPPCPPVAKVKKPIVHIPKIVQKQINKAAAKAAQKSGVEIDPNAVDVAIKDAQTPKPCIVVPPVKK